MIGIRSAKHRRPEQSVKRVQHGTFDRWRVPSSSREVLRKLDSFLSYKSDYKLCRENRHVEGRGVPAVKSRIVVLEKDDDETVDESAAALGEEALLRMPDVDKHCHEYTSDEINDSTTNRRSAIAGWGIGLTIWLCGEQDTRATAWAEEISRAPSRVKYVAKKQGFQFEYPSESFVVAFDRTGGGTKDGALVSVGDFTKYIVVSVFQQQQSQGIPPSVVSGGLDTESGHALCLDPVIQADSTVGFRVIEALMIPPKAQGSSPAAAGDAGNKNENNGKRGVFAFEYQVSICRGDTILEGKGGALRCQGVFGQDVPIQDKHVAGRAFINNQGSLVTIMASVPSEAWQSSEQVVRDIIRSFTFH